VGSRRVGRSGAGRVASCRNSVHSPRGILRGEHVGGHPLYLGATMPAESSACLADDGGPVGLVLAKRLAGLVARDQDPAAAAAQMLPFVHLRRTTPGDQSWSGMVGLGDVRLPSRIRLLVVTERVGDRHGEVFDQVAHGPVR
jgi:hypothetical protein